MSTSEDRFGHVTVRCGWLKFSDETPDTDEKIVVLEKGTHYVSIAEHNGKKWINAADDTDLDIEYWYYVLGIPGDSDSE